MELKHKVSTLGAALASLPQPLDRLHGSEPVLVLPLDGELSGAIDHLAWRATAESQLQVQVLSGANDRDADGVFGPRRAGTSAALRPLLEPVLGAAYVKLALDGHASVNGRRPGGAGRLDLSGQARVALGAYLRRDAEARLDQVLAPDAAEMPFILSADDVRHLAIGDACYCQLGGSLAARLRVAWADLFGGPVEAFRGLVPSQAPLHLAFDADAAAEVSVEINDGFRTVFIGEDAESVRVVLNRSRSDAFRLRAEASIRGGLADADVPPGVLARVLAQLFAPRAAPMPGWEAALLDWLGGCRDAVEELRRQLGDAVDRLDAAVEAAGAPRRLAQLQRLQTVVDEVGGVDAALAARLDLPLARARAVLETLASLADHLRERIDDRLDDWLATLGQPGVRAAHVPALAALLARADAVEAALVAAANHKINLGLAVEYRRLATDAIVFEAHLRRDAADFAKSHRALLRLDLERLLAAEGGDGVTLVQFLHQRSLLRRFSLGLDLGAFYGEDLVSQSRWTESLRRVPRAGGEAGLATERRLAFLGFRSREERNFFDQALTCRGDLDAQFLAPGDEAVPGRWRLTLSLSAELGETAADATALARVADHASVWGVIGERDATDFVQVLAATGALGQPIRAAFGLTVGNGAFQEPRFLAAWAELDDALAVEALAAALPRLDELPERREVATRIAAYAPALPVLLLHGEVGVDLHDAEGIAHYVGRHLDGSAAARRFEDAQQPGSVAWMNARAGRDGNFLAATRRLAQAGTQLQRLQRDAYGRMDERARVEEAFAGLGIAWQNRFALRWQVWLLRRVAALARLPAGVCQARLKFTVGEGAQARSHVFAAAKELA